MTDPTRPDGTRSTDAPDGGPRTSFAAEGDVPQLTGALERRLRIVRPLGDGGMGTVYEVEHLVTKHRRALKILHAEQSSRPEVVQRFLREASVAGKLRTPNVVETFDAGVLEDGRPFVLMELVPGKSLAALADEGLGKVPERVARLLAQVCEGMIVAHEKGVIHRDLKPENVIVTPDEHVKILDFGISKFLEPEDVSSSVTREGALLGTPHYMSPEQAMGRPVDPRTDVYAIGAIGYELLAGVPPFEATRLPELLVKIHLGEHEHLSSAAPHASAELAAVLERAMHKDAEQRTPTMKALRDALLPFGERGAARRGDGATVDAAVPPRGERPKSSISIDVEEATDVSPRTSRELAATVVADSVLPPASVARESAAPAHDGKSAPPPAAALPAVTVETAASAKTVESAAPAETPRRTSRTTWVAVGIAVVTVLGLGAWAVATHAGTQARPEAPSAVITVPSPPPVHEDPQQLAPPPPLPPTHTDTPTQSGQTPPAEHGHGGGQGAHGGHGLDPNGIDRHNPFDE